MTNIDELPDLMVELIETAKAQDEGVEVPARAREIINEIAEYAKKTRLYAEFQERSEAFWEPDDTATEIYLFMLQKIVNAPTQIHRNAAVLLHMPALAEALKSENTP